MRAVKGNYLSGTPLTGEGFETIWFDFGMVAGGIDELAPDFREFQMKYATPNAQSRKPYTQVSDIPKQPWNPPIPWLFA